LPAIGSNTLLAPEGVQNLFGGDFLMYIDKEKFYLNTKILEDVEFFDEALEVCETLAQQTLHKKSETEEVFHNILTKRANGLTKSESSSYYKIYEGLKKVKEAGRDSIWKFIVQNLYKPYFLSNKFDYIIGNPPWFTYSSIKNEVHLPLKIRPFRSSQMYNFRRFNDEKVTIHRNTDCPSAQGV
jgi:hypothetical protein